MLRNACWTLAPRRHLSNNVSLIDCFFFSWGVVRVWDTIHWDLFSFPLFGLTCV